MSAALVLLVPLLVVGALVGLSLYLRGGPPTAHGYAVNATPRRRRQVSDRVLGLLRPFLVYNHHRDAYVLRVVGNRIGPVLRPRQEGWRTREGLPEVRHTGRFVREPDEERPEPAEAVVEEPVEATVAPPKRAPVGARDGPGPRPPTQPAGKRSGKPGSKGGAGKPAGKPGSPRAQTGGNKKTKAAKRGG